MSWYAEIFCVGWDHRSVWTIFEIGSLWPPPRPPQKSNSSFIVQFLWNLKHIFICVLMIIEIQIYKLGPPYPCEALPPLLRKVKFFIYCVIFMIFETQHPVKADAAPQNLKKKLRRWAEACCYIGQSQSCHFFKSRRSTLWPLNNPQLRIWRDPIKRKTMPKTAC